MQQITSTSDERKYLDELWAWDFQVEQEAPIYQTWFDALHHLER